MSGSTRAFGIIILALLLLSRIPLVAEYFDGDNVNLAFGLERFDPHQDQPQPPGYPFLVGFARIVNLAFHDVNKTFRLNASCGWSNVTGDSTNPCKKQSSFNEGRKVFYSDVASDAAPFEIADFVFVPTNQ